MPKELKVELDASEIELLQKIHTARQIQDMMNHPGYKLFSGIVKMMLERLENQHLNFAGQGSKDAYWASGLRLCGAREFAMVLENQILQEIGILDQPLTTGNRSESEDV